MNGTKRRPLVWSWPPVPVHPGPKGPYDNEDQEKLETGSAAGGSEPEEAMDQAAGTKQEDKPAEDILSSPELVSEDKSQSGPLQEEKAAEKDEESEKNGTMISAGTLPVVTEERVPAPPMDHSHMPEYMDDCGLNYSQMRLARSYVPCQKFGQTYSPREALEKGTLFPDLFSPYTY